MFTPEFLSYQGTLRIKRNIQLKAIWPPSQIVDIIHYRMDLNLADKGVIW